MRWNVWVADWQMQCCGEPFSVGATVSWTLVPADQAWLAQALGEETAATIEWSEEHHDEPSASQMRVEAQVAGISAVHARMRLAEGKDAYSYPVDGVLSPLTSADGWTPNQGEREFIGYLVTLTTDEDPLT
ncbi:DUF6578 domain-containing protein [Nonomuraea ceibae]|uniref:DUF6578 domain-containing protein n=1 Tax=Nonomuraea ceibae TaxID=1935170 RepID=UPI001C607BF6|nr:DUF6578 domain-containing protein [Nonomuraea ceibae]